MIKSLVDLQSQFGVMIHMTTDKYKEKIVDWLDAPDPSSNHNKARQARQPRTGLWLLNSGEYETWKAETGGILWLHGIRKYEPESIRA